MPKAWSFYLTSKDKLVQRIVTKSKSCGFRGKQGN